MDSHSGTGYWSHQIDSTTWEVRFIANSTTEFPTVNKYVLYRSAELASEHGFDYFRVLDRSIDSSGPSSVDLDTYYSEDTSILKIPRSLPFPVSMGTHSVGMTVRMYRGQCPPNDPQAFDARLVLASLGRSIARSN